MVVATLYNIIKKGIDRGELSLIYLFLFTLIFIRFKGGFSFRL